MVIKITLKHSIFQWSLIHVEKLTSMINSNGSCQVLVWCVVAIGMRAGSNTNKYPTHWGAQAGWMVQSERCWSESMRNHFYKMIKRLHVCTGDLATLALLQVSKRTLGRYQSSIQHFLDKGVCWCQIDIIHWFFCW